MKRSATESVALDDSFESKKRKIQQTPLFEFPTQEPSTITQQEQPVIQNLENNAQISSDYNASEILTPQIIQQIMEITNAVQPDPPTTPHPMSQPNPIFLREPVGEQENMKLCSIPACKTPVENTKYKTCNSCREKGRKKREVALKKKQEQSLSANGKICSVPACSNVVEEQKFKTCSVCRDKQKQTHEKAREAKLETLQQSNVTLCSNLVCKNEIDDPKYKTCLDCRGKARIAAKKNYDKGRELQAESNNCINGIVVCSNLGCDTPVDGSCKTCQTCRDKKKIQRQNSQDKKLQQADLLTKPVCSNANCRNEITSGNFKTCSTCRERRKKTYSKNKEIRKQSVQDPNTCSKPSCKKETDDPKYKLCFDCRLKGQEQSQKRRLSKGEIEVPTILQEIELTHLELPSSDLPTEVLPQNPVQNPQQHNSVVDAILSQNPLVELIDSQAPLEIVEPQNNSAYPIVSEL